MAHVLSELRVLPCSEGFHTPQADRHALSRIKEIPLYPHVNPRSDKLTRAGSRLPLPSLSTLLPWLLPPRPRRWSSGRLPPGLVDTTRPYLCVETITVKIGFGFWSGLGSGSG